MKVQRLRRTLSAAALAAVVAGIVAVVAVAAPARSHAAPSNTAKPTIEGNFQIGETVSATNGTWTNNPTQYSYQWQRCNRSGTGCDDISGATAKSYKLVSDDVDHTLTVAVTAANPDGKATATSSASPVVSDSSAPRNTTRPTIGGTPQVGEQVTVSQGDWTGGVQSYSYQWQRCDANGDNCVDVSGATAEAYGVRSADADHTLRVEVTAKNAAGATTVNTDRSATVKPAAANNPAPAPSSKCAAGQTAVAAADLNLPERMLIDKFSFDPGVVTKGTQTITARIHVADTCGRSVTGAQLWSTAVPYNQTTVVNGQTGSDGWGTLQFQVRGGFPANPGRQQIMAMLVRAWKQGDSQLAGVSTRRVVRLNVNLHR